MNQGTAPPRPVDLSVESVAGEEDPGATLDLDAAEVRAAAAAAESAAQPDAPATKPGDEAAAGTPAKP